LFKGVIWSTAKEKNIELDDVLNTIIKTVRMTQLIKLSTKEKENALNEVRILASVNHETIIGYKEAFFEDATCCLCLVMEYADDSDLYQKIIKHQKSNDFIDE